MANTGIWHYLENQFDNATEESYKRANILGEDHLAKLAAETADPDILFLHERFSPVQVLYVEIYSGWLKEKGIYKGWTQRMDDIQSTLSSAKIAEWDNKIKAEVGEDSPEHTTLLPNGREPFQTGGRDARIMEVKGLSKRLEDFPALAAVKADVDAFLAQMNAIRDTQQQKEDLVEKNSDGLEAQRKAMCNMMYGDLGRLMDKYMDGPLVIDRFFELQLIRQTGAEEEEVLPIDPAEPLPGDPIV